MQLTIYLPRLQTILDNEPLLEQQLPGLQKIRKWSKKLPAATVGYENNVARLFQLPTIPFACYRGLADGLNTAQDYWLCADPVNLQVDLHAVYLRGNHKLTITQPEISSLTADLAHLLVDSALTLHTPHPQRWYLQSAQPLNINTAPYSQALAKNIGDFLPQGPQKKQWNRLLTEIQMVLYGHSVNDVRRLQGMPTIDSLWLWGGGQLTHSPTTNYIPASYF